MYREYKLATILNVITGMNALSSWEEVKSLSEYLNGEIVPDYKIVSALNNARTKLLLKNRQFIELDLIELKAGYNSAENPILFINNWIAQQEMIFGKRFKVYFDGEIEVIKNELSTANDDLGQMSFQKVKKPKFSNIPV